MPTLKELRKQASAKKIKGRSKMNKEDNFLKNVMILRKARP